MSLDLLVAQSTPDRLAGVLRRAVQRPEPWLVALALILFGASVGHRFTSWDDDVYVTRNPLIRDLSPAGALRVFTTFSNCNYHPLTYLTYMAEHAAVGLSPWLYHLDNVLLHAVAGVLAFRLARRWAGNSGAAAVAAILFLVHPLRVESVAWVAERKDLLCGVFYLGSLLAYTGYLERGGGVRYGASLSLFALALLSKVMAVTLPAALVLLLVARREASRARLAGLIPFAALAVLFAVLGIAAQAADGAVTPLRGGGLASHLLTIPKALGFYAEKLVFPVRLSPRYLLEPARSLFEPRVLLGSALIAAACAAAWRSLHRRRLAFLGLSFFAVTWAPVSGLIPSSTVVADRYLYLPSLGLFLSLGAWLAEGLRPGTGVSPPWHGWAARAGSVLTAVLVAGSFYLTPARVSVWRDGETLWADALRENPANPFAQNQLSLAYLQAGRYAEAAAAVEEAARRGISRPEHRFNLCLAYRGLGDGARELSTALDIHRTAPEFIPANLVILRHLREQGRLAEARSVLDRLSGRFPGDPGLLAARAELEAAGGDPKGALLHFLQSIEARPGDPEVLLATSAVLAALGDWTRALNLAERTLELGEGVLPPGALERLDEVIAVARSRGEPALAERARRLEERSGPRRPPQTVR